MINEERVKELYQAALYDTKKPREYQQMRQYFRSDYVGKEILKSVFFGTLAFILLFAVWVVLNGQELIEQINHIDYVGMGKDIGILYGVFMIIYFLITWIVYEVRYSKLKKEYQKYGETLKKINRIYIRDDKLKM